MLKRLVLHLGMGKTGSSTIQGFLRENAAQLGRDGFVAFGPGQIQPCPHLNLQDTGRLESALAEVNRCVRAERATGLIWSLEGFGTRQFVHRRRRLELLRRELPAGDVQLVVYLRRQDTFAASAYLQWNVVHKSYRGPVQSFDQRFPSLYGEPEGVPIEETNMNYVEILRPWVEMFGPASVKIRPFERQQFVQGDLLADFIDAAGLPEREYDRSVAKRNVTFNMELTDMLGMYGSVFEEPVLPGGMNRFFDAFGHDEFFQRPFFTRFELPPAQRRDILAACADINATVAREFLGREDGVLFREPWPDADAPYTPYGGLTLEKAVPILMHVLMKQHQEIGSLRTRIQEQTFSATVTRIRHALRRRLGRLFGRPA